jgi:hypothetical protein
MLEVAAAAESGRQVDCMAKRWEKETMTIAGGSAGLVG